MGTPTATTYIVTFTQKIENGEVVEVTEKSYESIEKDYLLDLLKKNLNDTIDDFNELSEKNYYLEQKLKRTTNLFIFVISALLTAFFLFK